MASALESLCCGSVATLLTCYWVYYFFYRVFDCLVLGCRFGGWWWWWRLNQEMNPDDIGGEMELKRRRYRVLPSFTECYRVLPSFIGFHWGDSTSIDGGPISIDFEDQKMTVQPSPAEGVDWYAELRPRRSLIGRPPSLAIPAGARRFSKRSESKKKTLKKKGGTRRKKNATTAASTRRRVFASFLLYLFLYFFIFYFVIFSAPVSI